VRQEDGRSLDMAELHALRKHLYAYAKEQGLEAIAYVSGGNQ
jgi:hypothetical protein